MKSRELGFGKHQALSLPPEVTSDKSFVTPLPAYGRGTMLPFSPKLGRNTSAQWSGAAGARIVQVWIHRQHHFLKPLWVTIKLAQKRINYSRAAGLERIPTVVGEWIIWFICVCLGLPETNPSNVKIFVILKPCPGLWAEYQRAQWENFAMLYFGLPET